MSPLTEKDRRDVEWIAQRDFDYVALSFVQRADDILELRRLLGEAGSDAQIIAKIEKPRALDQIDEIIDVADAVMVARGDLGVEMDFPAVPVAQKSITRKCQLASKPCIIATEMLESMVHSPTPTRAEVSDVANAVFDHTDAVMLSGESSIGAYPVETVRMMNDTLEAAQDYLEEHGRPVKIAIRDPITIAALAGAIRQITRVQDVAAVAVFTNGGMTARLISKNRPPCPILALASDMHIVRRCCLYYGVVPRLIEQPQDARELIDVASALSKELGIAKSGDNIIVISGHPVGSPDRTNGLIVERVR
jgi:pyruvate kinase